MKNTLQNEPLPVIKKNQKKGGRGQGIFYVEITWMYLNKTLRTVWGIYVYGNFMADTELINFSTLLAEGEGGRNTPPTRRFKTYEFYRKLFTIPNKCQKSTKS